MCRLSFYLNDKRVNTCLISKEKYYKYLINLSEKYDISIPLCFAYAHRYAAGVSSIYKPNLSLFVRYLWILCYEDGYIKGVDFLKDLIDENTIKVKLTVSIYDN